MRLVAKTVLVLLALFGPSALSIGPGLLGSSRAAAEDPPFIPVRVGLEAGVGVRSWEGEQDGAAFGAAVPIDLTLHEFLALGVRGRVMTSADPAEDADDDGQDDRESAGKTMFVLAGGPRLLLPTDPFHADLFRLGASFGVARLDSKSLPIMELSLERQVGLLFASEDSERAGYGTGHELTLGVHYQRGLTSRRDLDALLVTVGFTRELFVPLPPGYPEASEPDVRHSFDLRLRPQVLVGSDEGAIMTFAGGFGVGVAIVPALELVARWDAGVIALPNDRDDIAQHALSAGFRYRAELIFLELGVGRRFAFGTAIERSPDAFFLDATTGLSALGLLGCGFGLRFGPTIRLAASGDVTAGLALDVSYDSVVRARSYCD